MTSVRPLLVGLLALPLVLSACSSGSSGSAGSESAAASSADAGAVASVSQCAPGPPAASPLSITDYPNDNDYDGFVGAIYNDSDKPVLAWLVTGNTEGTKCEIPAKGRAAYAVSLPSDIETYIRVGPPGEQQPYANLSIRDPDIGEPSWYLTTPVNPYKSCGSVFEGQNQAFGEGSESGVKDNLGYGNGQGKYKIKRYDDDDKIARQWTGVNNWKVDDWIRADFWVLEQPYC